MGDPTIYCGDCHQRREACDCVTSDQHTPDHMADARRAFEIYRDRLIREGNEKIAEANRIQRILDAEATRS